VRIASIAKKLSVLPHGKQSINVVSGRRLGVALLAWLGSIPLQDAK
jgi:hypothetical protein